MSDERTIESMLAEILERANATPKPPWKWAWHECQLGLHATVFGRTVILLAHTEFDDDGDHRTTLLGREGLSCASKSELTEMGDEHPMGRFITSARTDVPRLLALVEYYRRVTHLSVNLEPRETMSIDREAIDILSGEEGG